MNCAAETLKHKFEMMRPVSDERGRRLWTGVEAGAIWRGGISRVAEATGLSRAAVARCSRRPAGTVSAIERLFEAEGRGVSERTVNRLPRGLGHSLKANRKTVEDRQHPDRDGQFRRISRRALLIRRTGFPGEWSHTLLPRR